MMYKPETNVLRNVLRIGTVMAFVAMGGAYCEAEESHSDTSSHFYYADHPVAKGLPGVEIKAPLPPTAENLEQTANASKFLEAAVIPRIAKLYEVISDGEYAHWMIDEEISHQNGGVNRFITVDSEDGFRMQYNVDEQNQLKHVMFSRSALEAPSDSRDDIAFGGFYISRVSDGSYEASAANYNVDFLTAANRSLQPGQEVALDMVFDPEWGVMLVSKYVRELEEQFGIAPARQA